jgi:hypothetical protein
MSDPMRGMPLEDEPELEPETQELIELADLLTRRLQSGEAVIDSGCVGAGASFNGTIRRLIPTLRTMVSFGELVAREEGSRSRFLAKKRADRGSL